MQKKKKPVIAYLHTHWDPEWYRTLEAFNARLVEVFDLVLAGLKKGCFPSFYFDGQVYALLNYLKFRPETAPIIKKLIKEKKLFIGPFFVSADNFLVSGASLIKNLELGLKASSKLGQKEFLGYLSDTFGHSKGIFEILKLFKIENAVIWRGAGDLPSDFTGNGIKTTRLVYGYYQDVLLSDKTADKKAHALEGILDKIDEKSKDILLLPLGGDHLAPLLNSSEIISEINGYLEKYEIKLGSPFEYAALADYGAAKYEGEFLDNSNTYILQGVYSARARTKAENAKLQWALFNRAMVFDYFTGQKHKAELDFAALELIKTHAHDSIYGCSTDKVNNAVKNRQQTVEETIKAVEGEIIRDFKKKNLIKKTPDSIGVFNFSNFEQEGAVSVISDKKIKNGQLVSKFYGADDEIIYDIQKNPMTEDFHDFYEYLIEVDKIKPFSFKNFEILKPVKTQTVGPDFIENPNLKLFILENKIFALNKKTGEIYEDFIRLHSTKDGGDSYNFAPLGYPSVLKFKSSKVKTSGKIKSTLRLNFEEGVILDVSLSNKSDFFEIEVSLNNKTKNRKLQAVISTGGASVTKTIAEDSIGTIERAHNPGYLLFENMPTKGREELKTGAYPAQRFVSANGVGVVTLGLNEYEVYENLLKITLLRSTGVISNPKNPARGAPAGPPIQTPDMQELGPCKMKFGITFSADLFKVADNFYGPFEGILGEFKFKNKTFINPPKNSLFYGISGSKPEGPLFLEKNKFTKMRLGDRMV